MESLIYLQRTQEDDLLDEFKKMFPLSSIAYANKDNLDSIVKKVSTPPMFSSEWVIIVNPYRLAANAYEQLSMSGLNFLVVVCTNPLIVEETVLMFDELKLPFRYMDGFLPSRESITEMLMKELGVSQRMATHLGTRANWSLDHIKTAMEYLQGLKKIRKVDIDYVVPLKPNATMDDVFEKFIGLPNNKEESVLYSVVERYRSSPRFLFQFFSERFELLLWIYQQIQLGYLYRANAKEFRQNHAKVIRSFGQYSNISSYRFENLVKCYHILSYDKLYYMKTVFDKVRKDNYSIGGFLFLLEVGV